MCDKSNIRLQKTNIFDTFSANSLKILDKSTEDFRLKYIENLYFTPDNKKLKTLTHQRLRIHLAKMIKIL